MTLGERIKKVRKVLDLTQQKFADQIGTTQNNIASYEIGRREPSSSAVNNICKTFNVSEKWLRTGDGEMFVQRSEEDELAAAVDRLITGESAEFKRRLVNALSTLSDEHWLVLEQKVKEIFGLQGASPAPSPAPAHTPTKEEEARAEAEPATDIASELAELKRQNQEMAAEIAAMKEEDAIKAAQSPSVSTGSFDPAQRAKNNPGEA